jgi:hypothetical protein
LRIFVWLVCPHIIVWFLYIFVLQRKLIYTVGIYSIFQ